MPALLTTPPPDLSPTYRFGAFELHSTQRVLLHQGQAIALGSRALQVLLALVARPGALLTKDDLLQAAWPGLVVEEANVHVAVSQLRKVLGKAAIATVGGLGYRFALPLLQPPAAAPRHQLPTPRTPFVGRAAELQAAGQQLHSTRLLTIVGMGGMGKTRLALKLADSLQHHYAGGAFFVDLAPVMDGSAVPGAVLRALGLPAAAGATSAANTAALLVHLNSVQGPHGAQGFEGLRKPQVLLVLDNCEHQVAAVRALVAALAAAADGAAHTTVLATSRQALDACGESCFVLRPLQLPAADEAPASTTASGSAGPFTSDAQQLFVQRVQADSPGFVFDAHSAPLVADICRRLDGIPLALELAAARMKMLSLQQLHGLLRQRFELLSRAAHGLLSSASTADAAAASPGRSSGPSGASTRQQTLQDVLHWSWDHLAPPQQTLAMALAVCSGGFDLDAAVALFGATSTTTSATETSSPAGSAAGPSPGNPVAVLDSLAQLADRALIHVTHGSDTARYGMLETVREYLLAQLARSGQTHAARQRHLQHFHALALRAEQATTGGMNAGQTGNDAAHWATRLDAERDNLMAALAWCHLHGSVTEGLQMVAALKNFWFASGWLEQGLQAAQAALARVQPERPTRLSARVHRLAAQLCLFMSRGDEGAVHARLALAQSQSLGDDAGAAAALCFAGRIAVKSEDARSGEALLHEALRRARAAGDLAVVGEALNALAFAAIERDDLAAAEAHFGQALQASQQRGSALGSVIETLNLAWVAVMNAGARPHAAQALHHGLERARQLLLSVWHSLQTMPHRYVAQELVDVCASFALHAASAGTAAHSRSWHQEAALLHAASSTQRQAIHLPLTAKQAARRASEAAAVRAALGEAGYDAAATDGRRQTHEQTLARVGGWLQSGPVAALLAGAGDTTCPVVTHPGKPGKAKNRKTKQPV